MSDRLDAVEGVDALLADDEETTTSRAPTAAELLAQGTGWFTRRHLRDLGLTRTAIDGIFRELDVFFAPGQKRGGAVRVKDFLDLVERCTYRDDRVRPT